MYFEQSKLPFSSMVQSAGGGEMWTQLYDDNKFREFGWRCTTNESNFKKDGPPLMANWSEERHDIESQKKMKPLPSQHDQYFTTTYSESHNKPDKGVPESIKYLIDRDPRAFSCHQPELDHPEVKNQCNSWETTYRVAYSLPALPHHMNPRTPLSEVYERDPPEVVALKDMQEKRKQLGPCPVIPEPDVPEYLSH